MPVEINALQTRAKAVAFANTLFWLCSESLLTRLLSTG